MLNTVVLVIWNMISQSAVAFLGVVFFFKLGISIRWWFFFWLCIFILGVFLHRDVLEAVTSPPGWPDPDPLPRNTPQRFFLSALRPPALAALPEGRHRRGSAVPAAASPSRGGLHPGVRPPAGAGDAAGGCAGRPAEERRVPGETASPGRGCPAGAGEPEVCRTGGYRRAGETGVLVFFIPCAFHRTWKVAKVKFMGKTETTKKRKKKKVDFPFLLNGFSLILTWFYHVPVEGLRVYTVC